MTSNIVSAISDALTPDIVNKIAIASGLDRSMAQKAVSAAVPTILSRIADAVSKPDRAEKLMDAITEQPANLLENFGGILAGAAKTATDGRGILSSLLGSNAPNLLASTMTRFLGISSGAAQTVLGLVTPLIMGTLARVQRTKGLDAAGLARLLIKQKEGIADAMPVGLSGFLEDPKPFDDTDDPLPRVPRAYEKRSTRSGAASAETAVNRRMVWAYWGLTLAALGGLLWALLPSPTGPIETAAISAPASPPYLLVPTPERKPTYFVRPAEGWRSIGASPNDFVDQRIYNADGESMGIVRDLLIRPDGTAAAAVLSIGRQLGIGEKEVAVPISMLRRERRESGNRIVVDVLKGALLSAPSYEGHLEQKR